MSPVFSQGLSPQKAEIFQAMCGEMSGLAYQISSLRRNVSGSQPRRYLSLGIH